MLADAATIAGDSAAPGYLSGFGGLPAPGLRELAKSAKLRPLIHPKDRPPEPQYRPSTALAEFVRCRDLTCRFPGCDRPAAHCDIDHTVPYPLGPTHASNLKLLCRIHHRLKSFYAGSHGWQDRQEPDGTVFWTAPSGDTSTPPGPAGVFSFRRWPSRPAHWCCRRICRHRRSIEV
ncbi:HNH endonuclease signature motif containing protein [Mycobacterium basiliense]|uniref:HNH endonuclease signature motif containing protein n=1 Tax=Mycobacterium basiliense TaxID=2094119 RepID=UPI0038CC0ABF